MNYFDKEYALINNLVNLRLDSIIFGNNNKPSFSLINDNIIIESNNISSYWYRRHEFNISPIKRKDYLSINAFKHLCFERDAIHEFINFALDCKWNIGSFNTQNINKLKCLYIANEVGLIIPIILPKIRTAS